MTLLKVLIIIIIGLSGGVVVGAGLVAFLTVLDIVPRLTQITKTYAYLQPYQWAIVSGSVVWTWLGLRDIHFALPADITIVYGIFAGMFIGMLAAGLTEVLNVWPILAKRMGMVERIIWLMMAMVFGKVIGSLFQWVFLNPF